MEKSVSKSIMLIDDNPEDNHYHDVILSRDARVSSTIIFTNPHSALEFFIPHEESITPFYPDVILLDLKMPEMDAWEFLQKFSQLPVSENIPVYLLSGVIDPESENLKKHQKLYIDYIEKPLTSKKIDIIFCSKKFPHSLRITERNL